MSSHPIQGRRQTLKFAATLLASGGSIGWLQQVFASGKHPITPGIKQLSGKVMIDHQEAKLGMIIQPGQTIETGADGEVVLVKESSAFLIRQNSKIHFDESGVLPVLRVLTGKILSVFGTGQRQLVTPTATVGIRGTGCYTEVEQDQTYFCLCYGTVDLTPHADPGAKLSYTTTHHDRPLYIYSTGAPKVVTPAHVSNHTDAELTMLESVVGRLPPFYK